jgi:hypothetical protein
MVVRMLRDAEIGIDEAAAGRWLAPFRAANPHPKSRRSQNPAFAQPIPSTPAAQIQHIPSTSPALRAQNMVPLFSEPLSSLREDPKATKKPKRPPAEWTVPLLADTTALNERELRSLSPAELHTLARAHALLFGNCTVTEKTNKARASPVATGLKYLLETLKRAQWAKWADLSVREYLDAGRNVTKRRGGVPWFQPSLILPELPDGAAYAKTSTQPGHDSTPERGAFGQPPRAYPEVSGLERHPLGCGPDDRSRERPPPALAG